MILFFFIKLEWEVFSFLKFMRITSFFHRNFENPGVRGFHNFKKLKNLKLRFWNSEIFQKIES
jgi:hypothetical protein